MFDFEDFDMVDDKSDTLAQFLSHNHQKDRRAVGAVFYKDITEPVEEWPVNSVGVPIPPLTYDLIDSNSKTYLTRPTMSYILNSAVQGMCADQAEREMRASRKIPKFLYFSERISQRKDLKNLYAKAKKAYVDKLADDIMFLNDIKSIKRTEKGYEPTELKMAEMKIKQKTYVIERKHEEFKPDVTNIASTQLGVVIVPKKLEE